MYAEGWAGWDMGPAVNNGAYAGWYGGANGGGGALNAGANDSAATGGMDYGFTEDDMWTNLGIGGGGTHTTNGSDSGATRTTSPPARSSRNGESSFNVCSSFIT
ncbi:hypothetical protein BVX95_01205 [archaeon D22]|nr:hypothetical protein BVX95_01205 [archaeon D22]